MAGSEDLVDTLERIIREDALTFLGASAKRLATQPLHQVLLAAGNYRARMVDPLPRSVYRSRELDASLTDGTLRSAVAAIENELKQGLDMSPRLSDRFRRSYPKDATAKARRAFVDHLLSTWRCPSPTSRASPRQGSGGAR